MDIKENLALNLIKYRKSFNLTQLELAEKLNYSDKAVSKWERAESVPDLVVLKQIADLYNVKIDDLIAEPKKEVPKTNYYLPQKRLIISIFIASLVWLIAVVAFASIEIIFPGIQEHWPTWLAFLYALAITLIIFMVLTSIWGKNFLRFISASLLCWTAITAIFLTLLYSLISPPPSLWMIYLIGIPTQVCILLWFFYKQINHIFKKKEINKTA